MTNFDAFKAEVKYQNRRVVKMTPEKFAAEYMQDTNPLVRIMLVPFNEFCCQHNKTDADGHATCDVDKDCETCLRDFLNQEVSSNEKTDEKSDEG